MTAESAEEIKGKVRQAYARLAQRAEGPVPSRASCCQPVQATTSCCETAPQSSCCGSGSGTLSIEAEMTSQIYAEDEWSGLPQSVTEASAGCGNPTAIASLQPGEVVLDLGSGGGIDCFLAAEKVGPTGRVIGLDMTPEMVKLARRNAKRVGADNVDFRYGEIEEMPLPDESVDVIISNCVINLSPDKDAVFSESYRVLKPGGRMIVSDMVTHGPLPQVLQSYIDAWARCVSGALDEEVYLDKMRQAGLTDVRVTERTYANIAGIVASDGLRAILEGLDPPLSIDWLREQLDGKIASVTVVAHKPALDSGR